MGAARPQRAEETESGTERLATWKPPAFSDARRISLLLDRRANGKCSRPYPGKSERKGRARRSRYAALPAGLGARGTDGRAATAPARRHRWLRRRWSYL